MLPLRHTLPSGRELIVACLPGGLVRICYFKGQPSSPTVCLDPRGIRRAKPVESDGLQVNLIKGAIEISFSGQTLKVPFAALEKNEFEVQGMSGPLYGMRGITLEEPEDPRLALEEGILRSKGAPMRAGEQGDAGAPFAYSKTCGFYVDSIDGNFDVKGDAVTFSMVSRKDIEAYVWFGDCKRSIEAFSRITGKHPLPPKWALGFMHSQWKVDEPTTLETIRGYRSRNIPFDVFIFDFDFKAWGEDDYGEFRWNSTSGAGSVAPNLFPTGDSGKFAKEANALGATLVGIMKPRLMVNLPDGTITKAAKEATANKWWLKEKAFDDYMTHRAAHDLNFAKAGLRKWYWKHSKNLFDTGIEGWWNDEADGKQFSSLGHLQMQRSLYEGQSKDYPKLRVWSLNRNFYPGAQRFAYATWSGDIRTGWEHMAAQRVRMLATIGLGQPNWSMDSGGFIGNPTRENYARWIQFAAVTPVMRVHARYGLLRQPWVFGPKAEKAATEAIRLRYRLLPSLYSWQKESVETGVGIVRPLHWQYPEDGRFENHTASWMLGDALLVSPVVTKDKTQEIVLPKGNWCDFWTGKTVTGALVRQPNRTSWTDLPIYVREGSIFATQDPLPHTKAPGPAELTLHVYPSPGRIGRFTVYDDDGTTLSHEKNGYFAQSVSCEVKGVWTEVEFSGAKGAFQQSYESYRVEIRGRASRALWKGKRIPFRYAKGITQVTIPAGQKGVLRCKIA